MLHVSTLLGYPQATLIEMDPIALRHWFFIGGSLSTHCIDCMYILLVIFEEHSWPDELNVTVPLKLHKYRCIKDGEREPNEWLRMQEDAEM
jgi:hypothetical protein